MSRKTTRTVAGFATTAFVGFGVAFASPAFADEVETLDVDIQQEDAQEWEATCTLNGEPVEVDDSEGPYAYTLDVLAPETGETGEDVDVSVLPNMAFFYFEGEDIAAGDLTVSATLGLRGDAAPQETLSFSGTNPEPIGAGDDEWEPFELFSSYVPYDPGTVDYVPGAVTITATQPSGTTVTECSPVGDVPVLGSTEITGEPVTPPPGDDDDDDDDDGDDTPPPGDDDDNEEPAPTPPPSDDDGKDDDKDGDKDGDDKKPADENNGGGLPVTGAALGGLVAAALAALGGGGTAMFLSRRRKSEAATDEAGETSEE